MKPWSQQHAPKLAEIVGQDKAVETVLTYAKTWKRGTKPILLYGPTGSGKTCTVQAVAQALEYELIELNASDDRTGDLINQKALSAATQASLFGTRKIILLDEIDGIYGTKDRGGVPAILTLIQKTQYPVILTANDPYKTNIRSLRDKCQLVHFTKLDYRSISNRLETIAKVEGLKAGTDALQAIARRAGGDMRAAMMDLQSLAGESTISPQSLDDRDVTRDIFETLRLIFKGSFDSAREAINTTDKRPDELFLWLAHNLPYEYTRPGDLKEAYNLLSRADVFRGRIRRRQYWGFLRYQLELCAATASAKREKYQHFVKYQPPSLLIKMGRTKFIRAIRDSMAAKIGEQIHASRHVVRRDYLPYLRIVFEKNPKAAAAIADGCGLTPDEVSFLQKK